MWPQVLGTVSLPGREDLSPVLLSHGPVSPPIHREGPWPGPQRPLLADGWAGALAWWALSLVSSAPPVSLPQLFESLQVGDYPVPLSRPAAAYEEALQLVKDGKVPCRSLR